MAYISVKEAANKWGIDVSRVSRLAREGRIEGAVIVARNWLIPENAEKPQDGRTKAVKQEKEDFFRFPLYVNCDEDTFSPPLSNQERLLRKAELDYYACDFESAQKAFETLLQNTESIYIKIMVLFYLCSLSVEAYGGKDFALYFGGLQVELSKEFPRKKDMEIVIPWLYTIMVQFQAVSSSIEFDSFYDYSSTVLPLISYLSFYHLSNVDAAKTADTHLDVYEILCRDFLKNGRFYEACELQFLLFLANYVSMKEEAMLFHLKKALTLAWEHKFYIIAASYEFYYQNAFDAAFKDFPEDFVQMIKQYSKTISSSIGIFAKKHNNSDIYSTLSKNDYRYLAYAVQGKTNKEIAYSMHVSERTVAGHYNEIYNKLGISSKQELTAMLTDTFSK